MNGKCLESSVIYQATVTRTDHNSSETYVGLTDGEFKTRFRNHTASFRNQDKKNSNELSKHVWKLKENKLDYRISWKIVSKAKPYNSSTKRCNLCLREKYVIIFKPHLCSLNKRTELLSSCKHRHKALLRSN